MSTQVAFRKTGSVAGGAPTRGIAPRTSGATARIGRPSTTRSVGLKALVRRAAVGLGVVRAAMHLGGARVLRILRYHAVTPDAPYCSSHIAVTPEQFDRQLAYLRAHYTVMPLQAGIDAVQQAAPLPAPAVCITFDDGYLDNYTFAFPLLQKHRLTATFFVAAGPVIGAQPFWVGWLQSLVTQRADIADLAQRFGLVLPRGDAMPDRRQMLIDHIASMANRGGLAVRDEVLSQVGAWAGADAGSEFCRMMTIDQLRTMARAGMTIGSHTVTHPVLANLTDAEALRELTESKHILETAVDASVDHLAYPNGPGVPINFTDATKRLARVAGYLSASTSIRGVVSKASDRFALQRHGINRRLDDAAFAFKLEEHRFGLGRRATVAEGGV